MRILAVLIVAAAAAVSAAEGQWEGQASIGGLVTSGNSEVTQLDSGLELARQLLPFLTADMRASASYGSQEGDTYREKYMTETGLRWDISGSSYARLRGYWTRDDFSGISHEYGASAGLGRSLLSSAAFQATMEAGAGLLHRKSTADSILETSTGYLSLNLEWGATEIWTFTEEAKLTNDFQDSENYTMESVLEASSSITGNLSFLVGYDITYHNLPPVEGNERTDTALRLQLRLGI